MADSPPETGATCPTCGGPLLGAICSRCAFSRALSGLATDRNDTSETDETSADLDIYTLLQELGRGATAVVWLAHERRLDRLVALKLIPLEVDRRLTQRLVREGKAAATLRHPHLVAVHAMGTTKTHAFLAMEFLAGGDLRKKLSGAPLPPGLAAELVRKLADALAH